MHGKHALDNVGAESECLNLCIDSNNVATLLPQ